MAIALVNHVAAGSVAGAQVISAAIDTTGANLLVACVTCFRGASQVNVPTLVDSKGNTWTQLTDRASSTIVIIRTWYCSNPTVGTGHTFTFGANFSPAYMAGAVGAFSGVKVTSPFDTENGSATDAGSSLASGSITPAENNELIICGLAWGNTESPTVNSGMTILDSVPQAGGAHEGIALAYKVQSALAAINVTYSWTTATEATAEIAAFKAAASNVARSQAGSIF